VSCALAVLLLASCEDTVVGNSPDANKFDRHVDAGPADAAPLPDGLPADAHMAADAQPLTRACDPQNPDTCHCTWTSDMVSFEVSCTGLGSGIVACQCPGDRSCTLGALVGPDYCETGGCCEL